MFDSNPYDSIHFDSAKCGRYHFCRVKVDLGRRVEDLKAHSVVYTSEEVFGEGVAEKSSKDHNDDYVGETLALARAFNQLSRKLDKRAWGKVKHNDDMKLKKVKQAALRQLSQGVPDRKAFWHYLFGKS